MPASGEKKTVSRLLRVFGSAVALLVLFWFLPAGEVWAAARQVPATLWMASVVVFILGHLLAAMKWWAVVGIDSGVPLRSAIRVHYCGLAANLCLPGIVGGDFVRAGLLMKSRGNVPKIAVGSITDRLLDCLALLVLSVGGFAFSMRRALHVQGMLIASGITLAVALAAFFAVPAAAGRWSLPEPIERIAAAIADLRRQPVRIVACFTTSIVVQSVFVMLAAWLGWACGAGAELSGWFAAWPLAKLVAAVPISLAGLGVREATLATFLAQFGADPARAVAAGFVWQSVLFAGALIALGVVLVMGKWTSVRREIAPNVT